VIYRVVLTAIGMLHAKEDSIRNLQLLTICRRFHYCSNTPRTAFNIFQFFRLSGLARVCVSHRPSSRTIALWSPHRDFWPAGWTHRRQQCVWHRDNDLRIGKAGMGITSWTNSCWTRRRRNIRNFDFRGLRSCPGEKRGVITGINNLCYGAGTGLGVVYGGWINDTLGWKWAFLIQWACQFYSWPPFWFSSSSKYPPSRLRSLTYVEWII